MMPSRTSIFNVTDYGATGDGQTADTRAIQSAIEACNRAGGGTVYFPAGTYVTGSLFLCSNITLYLDAGATLAGSTAIEEYPIIVSRWEGAEKETHAPMIGGRDLHHLTIAGRGTIDGRGAGWWKMVRDQTLKHPRPRLISFENCSNVLIEGLTAVNSPSWTIHPLRCDNVTIDQVTIINPADSPNTDGINPESCHNVHISNCHIDVGDDCIAIKAGTENLGPDKLSPCENLTITNCTMVHGHGGVVLGSETSGGIRNVVISNCVFVGTDRGIRFKSRRGRGGIVEDVRVTNIVMTDVLCPITMNLYYGCGAWGDPYVSDKNPQPVTPGTPRMRRIQLSHITAHNAKYAAVFLYGLPEMPVEDISLSDVSISMAAEAEAGYPEMADGLELAQRQGFWACHVLGLRLRDVEITGQVGPALVLNQVTDIEINGRAIDTQVPDAPVVVTTNND